MIDLETYNRLAKSFGAPDFFISAIKITPVTTRSRAGRLGIMVSENLPILLLKQLGLRPNDIILEIQRKIDLFSSNSSEFSKSEILHIRLDDY